MCGRVGISYCRRKWVSLNCQSANRSILKVTFVAQTFISLRAVVALETRCGPHTLPGVLRTEYGSSRTRLWCS